MTPAAFTVTLENDQLLNGVEFAIFLSKNQNRDIVLTVNNEGHCCTHNKIYAILDNFNFRSVRIITCNALESHSVYQIDNTSWSIWLDHTDGFDFSFDYEWNQEKTFGCIYGRPSSARLGISGHLSKHYFDQSVLVTKFDHDHVDSRKLFDLQRLFAWDPDSAKNSLTMLPDRTQKYIKGEFSYANPVSYLYKSFMIDIVSEPVCEGKSFYPTEKLARCILCRRPFIVMASKNYLDYLHQMGFYSFSEFWDETYDGFDGADRYKRILLLIDHLASKSKQDLVDLYYASRFFLDHNFRMLTDKTFRKNLVPYHE